MSVPLSSFSTAALRAARIPPAAMPVLILDDTRFGQHRLARLCSGLDVPCDISTTTTLDDFAAALDRRRYALILVQDPLPDGTGLDAVGLVRLSARNLNAAMLVISGRADTGIADAVEAAGAGFLQKDELDRDSFAAAVEQALHAGQPDRIARQISYSPDEVAALMAHCATRSARDVKPMISRMLRQMRDLRAAGGGPDAQAAVLRAIEQNCMSLWAFLVEMEREEGATLLADLTAENTAGFGAGRTVPTTRQPRTSSIFSRRKN